MNYQETLNYIEGLAVFGSKPGFERINALLENLSHPEKGLKYVHVAGTNGKGSVCNTVANVLTAAGYKTGLFTSPFVSDFRERIQIDGNFIEKDKLCKLTERVKVVCEKLAKENIQPTEFEVITAVAFLYFKEEDCDVVVLEVGLGGLLDSTNVIDTPLVSAIVSLSFDHMGVLGNSIEEIAMHKAGIIKDGGVTVSAPHQPDGALHVLKTSAYEHGNKFIIADPNQISVIKENISGTTVKYKSNQFSLKLIGPHQIDNLSVSLAIIEELKLKGLFISDAALASGIEMTTVPARVEVVNQNPLIIIDGGHNEDGARVLAKTLQEFTADKKKTLLIGVMADKEVEKVLKYLAPLATRIITTTPDSPRSMPAAELAELASKYASATCATNCTPCEDPCKAYDLARSLMAADSADSTTSGTNNTASADNAANSTNNAANSTNNADSTDNSNALIVCGSLYLAGNVRGHILDTLKGNN